MILNNIISIVDIRAKYTSFPNRQSKPPKLKFRRKRSSGDASNSAAGGESTILSESNVSNILNVAVISC